MLNPGAADEIAAVVFDDLASALDAGLPLPTLGGNPALGDHVLLDLCWRRGVQLSQSEKAVLEAGWRAGTAVTALRDRAENRRRRAQFARELWTALRYPLTLLVMLLVAAIATMAVVGPVVLIVIASTYVAIAAVLWWLSRKLRRGDAALDNLPWIGSLVADVRELPYLEALHALYSAGVPIVDAHRAAVQAVRMQGLRDRLAIAQRLLEDGSKLEESLAQSVALSQETRQLLATGEQAGQLEDALRRAMIRRQDVATRRLTAAARRFGQVAYGFAVIGVGLIVVLFWTRYYGMLTGR